MTKQKLLLIIGFPLFGILLTALPPLLGAPSIIQTIGLTVNFGPMIMIWIFDFIILDLPNTSIDSDHIIYSIFFVIFNIIFWVPVAIWINGFIENRKN